MSKRSVSTGAGPPASVQQRLAGGGGSVSTMHSHTSLSNRPPIPTYMRQSDPHLKPPALSTASSISDLAGLAGHSRSSSSLSTSSHRSGDTTRSSGQGSPSKWMNKAANLLTAKTQSLKQTLMSTSAGGGLPAVMESAIGRDDEDSVALMKVRESELKDKLKHYEFKMERLKEDCEQAEKEAAEARTTIRELRQLMEERETEYERELNLRDRQIRLLKVGRPEITAQEALQTPSDEVELETGKTDKDETMKPMDPKERMQIKMDKLDVMTNKLRAILAPLLSKRPLVLPTSTSEAKSPPELSTQSLSEEPDRRISPNTSSKLRQVDLVEQASKVIETDEKVAAFIPARSDSLYSSVDTMLDIDDKSDASVTFHLPDVSSIANITAQHFDDPYPEPEKSLNNEASGYSSMNNENDEVDALKQSLMDMMSKF